MLARCGDVRVAADTRRLRYRAILRRQTRRGNRAVRRASAIRSDGAAVLAGAHADSPGATACGAAGGPARGGDDTSAVATDDCAAGHEQYDRAIAAAGIDG